MLSSFSTVSSTVHRHPLNIDLLRDDDGGSNQRKISSFFKGEPQETKRAADQRHPHTHRILDRRESKFRQLTLAEAVALSVLFRKTKRTGDVAESFNSVSGALPGLRDKDYRIKYSHVAQRKPTPSTDGIRKLSTMHLATSSARKLRSSVRREEIMRHDNRANERRREYITNNSLTIYNSFHPGCFRGEIMIVSFL